MFNNILHTIGSVIVAGAMIVGGWFGYIPDQQPVEVEIGAFNTVGGQVYYLQGGGVSSTDTSITLTEFDIPVSGDNLTMTHFGDIGYLTLEPGSATRQEFVSFTGITQNADGTATLTGVTRGLLPVSPYTASSTYQKAHPGGSIVVISNPPQLYEQFGTLSNDETISGYWDAPTPLANDNIAIKSYVDGLVNGGTVSNSRVTVAGNAGETIATSSLIYFDTTENEWMVTSAATSTSIENTLLGIAQGPGTDGNAITGGVLLWGLDENQTGLTAGDVLYASNTEGAIANSAGTTEVTVGIARNATTFYFMPRFNQQITEDQQDALGGTSGTPSNTNKYVTDDDTTGTGSVLRASAGGLTCKNGVTTRSGAGTDGEATIAHGLGAVPDWIRLDALWYAEDGGNVATIAHSMGLANGTATTSISGAIDTENDTSNVDKNGNSSTYILELHQAPTTYQRATTTTDGTNITLGWDANNTGAGTIQILWQACANNS